MPVTKSTTDHTDHHTIAADCHDKAALQHREAAQLQLAGDQEKASHCTKLAREFGVQAMQHGSKCGKDDDAIAKNVIAKGANGGSHRPL